MLKTSAQHDAQIRYNCCTSVYFGVLSNQSLATSLALKPFDGGNLIKGLMGCSFELVSSYHPTIKIKKRDNFKCMR